MSSDVSTAALPFTALLKAAESLAKTFVQMCSDGSAICSSCTRGSVAGVLTHSGNCAAGRTLALAEAAQRTGAHRTGGREYAEPVESDEPAHLRRVVLDYDQVMAERRVVCGRPWIYGEGTPATCDKAIGHDADPDSSHWNRERGFSWPTRAKVEREYMRTGVISIDEVPR